MGEVETARRELMPVTRGREPPPFLGDQVGEGLHGLDGTASWTVARTITAPQLTRRLLADEPGFGELADSQLVQAANTLTFLLEHLHRWSLRWAESVAGPARFTDERRVKVGVSDQTARDLSLTVGVKAGGNLWAVSAEASAQWSRLTRSTVTITEESEFTRKLEFDVPAGGMDIALWQLESVLVRRLMLRPGRSLPPEPLPRWVDLAVAAASRLQSIPCSLVKTTTRT